MAVKSKGETKALETMLRKIEMKWNRQKATLTETHEELNYVRSQLGLPAEELIV